MKHAFDIMIKLLQQHDKFKNGFCKTLLIGYSEKDPMKTGEWRLAAIMNMKGRSALNSTFFRGIGMDNSIIDKPEKNILFVATFGDQKQNLLFRQLFLKFQHIITFLSPPFATTQNI